MLTKVKNLETQLQIDDPVPQNRRRALDVNNGLGYTVDFHIRELLLESAPLMNAWSENKCRGKHQGGMEAWAKDNEKDHVNSCDWYHSTWQYLRLVDMVATPPWYPFYMRALGQLLAAKPDCELFISAAADWGMLAMVHEAAAAVNAAPRITLWDICETPIAASKWYADKFGMSIETKVQNIITDSAELDGRFDIVVTDEFLTVLADPLKPQITERWRHLLKPGGSVVTTAMVGGPTTPELRQVFYTRAMSLFDRDTFLFRRMGVTREEFSEQVAVFASVHTRHMLTSPEQLETLFADYELDYSAVVTPGECVNPTTSFQIVARRPL
ncbi:class I SAM-dependent methyltransferase [Paucibacter sp. APW11]|uniref:Class I SAM-dependent methyltransferase n=1 Tax=Roseateles aquae TaxID=3077235 RepID=A0ABU3PC22_9BURK|nr:class I SAM-dependent methyltransferase [Paucibacter sp. APW11]MDT8999698.1 class I SAM-dependent methyltransferase [Paucibacter sp. APW11]